MTLEFDLPSAGGPQRIAPVAELPVPAGSPIVAMPKRTYQPNTSRRKKRHGFLKRMYEDENVKPAFQHMVLMSLAGDLLKALAREPKPKYIITERSPWGNYHVFGKANLEGDDFKMYEFTWKRLMAGLPAKLQKRYLWLKAGETYEDLELLHKRMNKRMHILDVIARVVPWTLVACVDGRALAVSTVQRPLVICPAI